MLTLILEYLRNYFVEFVGVLFLCGVLCVAVFMWLNCKSARADERFYDKRVDLDKKFRANIAHGSPDESIDPEKALKAYAEPDPGPRRKKKT